jgi:hypothetical protein
MNSKKGNAKISEKFELYNKGEDIFIQNVPFKSQPQLLHIHAQNDEARGNVELSQLYSVAAADVLLEICAAVI